MDVSAILDQVALAMKTAASVRSIVVPFLEPCGDAYLNGKAFMSRSELTVYAFSSNSVARKIVKGMNRKPTLRANLVLVHFRIPLSDPTFDPA